MTDAGIQLETAPRALARGERFPPGARVALELAVTELVDALRNHHTGTADHSNRLAVDCRRVGEKLGLAPDELFELELVAILHDIGKLAVPAAILDLARPLESGERVVVRSHTVHGAEILAEISGLRHLAPLVRASHERWDGTGYPDGARGDGIPLAARIVFTVDAFDAMTNDRPYRLALARPEARSRHRGGRGHGVRPERRPAPCSARSSGASATLASLRDAQHLSRHDHVRIVELVAVGGEDDRELRRVAVERVGDRGERSPGSTVWMVKPWNGSTRARPNTIGITRLLISLPSSAETS